MVIFIDESGTHKQSGLATIVLTYVTIEHLEAFEKYVEAIEEELSIKYFHWSDERWATREKFLKRLLKLEFTFKVAIVENPISLSQSMEDALRHLVVEKDIRKIVIDGRQPKWYGQKIKKILRDKGISVKKIVTVRKEESSPGVRVSDCLAGLMRYYYADPDGPARVWYHKLRKTNKISFELRANP